MDFSRLGMEPISADQPAGCDVRYDPVFDQLQAEIDRSALPAAAGTTDWEKVVTLSADLLSGKSKDLLVAGYLAVGLVHTRRLDGLTVALKIYRDLLEHHAAALFPQRERGRLRSVQWWVEKSEAALRTFGECTIDPGQLALMEEQLEKIGQSLGELLPEAPSLRVLRELLQQAAQPAPASSPACTPPSSGAAASLPTPQGEAAPVKPQPTGSPARDGRAAVEAGLAGLRDAANLLRELDITNPLAYRCSRQAAWLDVNELPPASAGRTLLPPPSPLLRNRLADLGRAGDGCALLREIEAQLYQFIFWLDLNRLAAEALGRLGASPAAAAVARETSFLLQRLPGLELLLYADGTPFAEAETRQWLQKHQLRGQSQRAEPAPPKAPGPQPAQEVLMRSEAEAADSLISEGKLIEAIDRLQERLRNCNSERERIQWRLALSRVLMNAEQTRFALPHLEQVVNDIDTYRLESYDPGIALEASKLAWLGFDSRAEPHFKEKAQESLHRIARIDLAEMVRLAGE